MIQELREFKVRMYKKFGEWLNEDTLLAYNKYKINSYNLIVFILGFSSAILGITPVLFTFKIIFNPIDPGFMFPFYEYITALIVFFISTVLFLYKSNKYKVFKSTSCSFKIIGIFLGFIVAMSLLSFLYVVKENEDRIEVVGHFILAFILGYILAVFCLYMSLSFHRIYIKRIKEINLIKDTSQDNNDTH